MGPVRMRTVRRALREQGVVLIVALIALLVLSLGAIALIRVIDADSGMAGNFAFREASAVAADIGLNRAIAAIPSLGNLDVDVPASGYYASVTAFSNAAPLATRWSSVPCRDVAVSASATAAAVACDDTGRFRMQALIERLCTVTPVTDPLVQCLTGDVVDDGSKKSNAPDLGIDTRIQYRISVRVRGPRNAESLVQSLVAL